MILECKMRSMFRSIFFDNENNTFSNITIFLILETKKEFLTKNNVEQYIEMITSSPLLYFQYRFMYLKESSSQQFQSNYQTS